MTNKRRILMPLPSTDFDPTEAGVPWQVLKDAGHEVRFATPDGKPGKADFRMLTGFGLGIWKPLLRANLRGRSCYKRMSATPEYHRPTPWKDVDPESFDALILPGGHAPGMKEYLESKRLQELVAQAFHAGKPVGAICHGVVLAARSTAPDGHSVLHRKKTTALLKKQELLAAAITPWLGDYYRTYPQTVEDEVRRALKDPETQFEKGPIPLLRDGRDDPKHGFALVDGRYVSARWPGDAHAFAYAFDKVLKWG